MSFIVVSRVFTAALAVYGTYALWQLPSLSIADLVEQYSGLTIALKCCVLGNIAFWICSIICVILDIFPRSTALGKWLHASKIQHKYFSVGNYVDTACVAAFNMILIAPLLCIPYESAWASGVGGLYNRTQEEDPFNWWREILNVLGSAVIVNLWFYWTHRLIHNEKLYAPIHKIHHKWQAPCSAAAVFAHPVEYALSNVAGIALGPMLTNAHPYTAYFWFMLALVQTCRGHSGYHFLGADSHDAHHEFFNYNFGVGPVCDRLFGTLLPKEKEHKFD
mgnify:CR=1 FL=1